MALWKLRSNRKPTGGRLVALMKKKKRNRGSEFLEPKIGEPKFKLVRTAGGNFKVKALSIKEANVADKGKITKTKVLTVVENTANPNYVRRNVVTKGCVIKTELGLAKVTSRPSKDGIVNAVLVKS